MSSKQCPECGDKIIGRTDKKFCSDGCRNTYNNRMNKDQKNLMRNINNRLRKNWRILEQLNPDHKTKKSRAQLIALGFDFNYLRSPRPASFDTLAGSSSDASKSAGSSSKCTRRAFFFAKSASAFDLFCSPSVKTR